MSETAPDGLPIYELGDPETPYGASVMGGCYIIVRPPDDDLAAAGGTPPQPTGEQQ